MFAERTFGWLGWYRQLPRDYELTVSSSEAITYLASARRQQAEGSLTSSGQLLSCAERSHAAHYCTTEYLPDIN